MEDELFWHSGAASEAEGNASVKGDTGEGERERVRGRSGRGRGSGRGRKEAPLFSPAAA